MVGVTLFGTYGAKKIGKPQGETVLESGLGTPTPNPEDDFELWDQSQMLRSDANAPFYKWGKGSWCKPSCIPISIILILIVLVVLLPLLDHHPNDKFGAHRSSLLCPQTCRIRIVESIPEGLVYPSGSPSFMSTYDAWQRLINTSTSSIDIGSFYWTLRSNEVANHSSSANGEQIFQALSKYGRGGRRLRIAQNLPSKENPNVDTSVLAKRGAAEVRSVNFPKLIGSGILHTKVWVVDDKHVYLGSANMDWRSLTQVKELGVLVENCSCLAQDMGKIFSVYWEMGEEDAKIPNKWPEGLATKINADHPVRVNYSADHSANVFISSSPGKMNPKGRTHDLEAIKKTILKAEKFVYISVMDYFPTFLYTPTHKFWPEIDNALRTAALDNQVNVRMLISWWNHSRSSEDYFLRSLEAITGAEKNVKLEVKRFIVPTSEDQAKIPFARVNHNKYMVTDKTAYIGTSNWSADYFTDTAGIGILFEETCDAHDDDCLHHNATTTIRGQLESIFLRDWNSAYAVPLKRRSS